MPKEFEAISNFNPSNVTLLQAIQQYGKAADSQTLVNAIKNNPALKGYLDLPLLDFFEEAGSNTDNPLLRGFRHLETVAEEKFKLGKVKDPTAAAAKRNLHSAVRALEYNLDFKLPDKYEKVSVYVPNPDKPVGKAFRYAFNTDAIGDLELALREYAVKNPNDASVVRSILVNLHTGLRPSEVIANNKGEYKFVQSGVISKGKGSSAPGIVSYNSKASKLNKRPIDINIPIGPRVFSLLQDQLAANEWLSKNPPEGNLSNSWGNTVFSEDAPVFVMPDGTPVKTADQTRVLKQLKIPKALYNFETKKWEDAIPSSYFMRSFWHTLAYETFGDLYKISALTGRPIGAEKLEAWGYISSVPGKYSEEFVEIPNTLDVKIWQQFNQSLRPHLEPEFQKLIDEGKLLNYDLDVLSGEKTITAADFSDAKTFEIPKKVGKIPESISFITPDMKTPESNIGHNINPDQAQLPDAKGETPQYTSKSKKPSPWLKYYPKKPPPGTGIAVGLAGVPVLGTFFDVQQAHANITTPEDKFLHGAGSGLSKSFQKAGRTIVDFVEPIPFLGELMFPKKGDITQELSKKGAKLHHQAEMGFMDKFKSQLQPSLTN